MKYGSSEVQAEFSCFDKANIIRIYTYSVMRDFEHAINLYTAVDRYQRNQIHQPLHTKKSMLKIFRAARRAARHNTTAPSPDLHTAAVPTLKRACRLSDLGKGQVTT